MSLERSVPRYQRLDTALFIYVLNLYCSESGGKSTYQGKTVTALVGSSVNFTWNFSGDVGRVQWGLKMVDMYDIDYNNRLVVLVVGFGSVPFSVPSAYVGRVSGVLFSGQAIFTLSSITRNDEDFYGCVIRSSSIVQSEFDYLRLFVLGKFLCGL